MGVPDKPEDPIAEFVFWQERRYACAMQSRRAR